MPVLIASALGRPWRLIDRLLVGLVVTAAFLLGCQELFDSDVWWHVRAGQWIWANSRVPDLDPFTFASADRHWIDLHWLFQLLLAGVYRLAGVRGMILLAAGICATTILVGVTTRQRQWPVAVVVACWLPALGAMSARFDPRPEVLSLLGVAVYLAVLFRADRSPRLVWLLPLVQVIWVNVHALFVLGPVILGAYLIDRVAELLIRPRSRDDSGGHPRAHWRFHLAGALVAVVVACLVNPYGWRGAVFPFELFPKITAWGGPYKSYVAEFMDVRSFVQKTGTDSAAGDFFFRAECFLLWMVPLSFLLPAVWESSRRTTVQGAESRQGCLAWIAASALATGLIAVCPPVDAEGSSMLWIAPLGRFVPWALVACGLAGGVLLLLARSPLAAALLAAIGGAAEGAWAAWLRAHLSGTDAALLLTGITACLGLVAVLLILRSSRRESGRLFRVILSVAFGYLAIVAVRNVNLFGLVAGFVMAWNLGSWAYELTATNTAATGSQPRRLRVGPIASGGLAVVAGLWIVAIVSGRFFPFAGESRRFGLAETPLAYAHDASKFAGQAGMPERALALDLGQAGVYLFHNGPERKVYIDGRLEIPTRASFETFVRLAAMLDEGRPGWPEAVRRLGNPLILLGHAEDFGAEATLLAHPGWRCVYYDAVASVFITDGSDARAAIFPSVAFAERHFTDPAWRAGPPTKYALGEAGALIRLGSTVGRRPNLRSRWDLRASLMLLAADRLHQALAARSGIDGIPPSTAGLWNLLGHATWSMAPDLSVPPAGPSEAWDPARGLFMAQATFCYRRSLEIEPRGASAMASLRDSFKMRRMNDAERSAVASLRRLQGIAQVSKKAISGRADERPLNGDADVSSPPAWDGEAGFAGAVTALIEDGQPEAAVRAFADGIRKGIEPAWTLCDRVAATHLHLGHAAEASSIWERAAAPPSRAVQLTRVATAALAAFEFATALDRYQSALQLDPRLAEAWFCVALLNTERGDAARALEAARQGLKQNPTRSQRDLLRAIEALVAPYAGARAASVP
jgi:tetratricopeptide (TPR) repeat protein